MKFPVWLGCVWAFATIGCATEEDIRVVRVPKTASVSLRTLAVMAARPDATWFFKMSGPTEAVTANQGEFRQFIESLTFTLSDPPLTWKSPPLWNSVSAGPQRHACWRTANGLEVSITKLGPEAKDVLDNVNRWRRQINLSPIDETGLSSVTQAITIGSEPAVWVDLKTNGAVHAAEQVPAITPLPAATKPRIEYTTPAGWQTLPTNTLRVAAFRIGSGDDSAEVTVIPLAGSAGGLAANVNRWRGELGLSTDLSESQIKADAKELLFNGKPEPYFDLLGPEKPKRQRSLIVMATRHDTTWFIKMRGAAEIVARQQGAFESFVRSIRFSEESR